jgi:hypothetical protein
MLPITITTTIDNNNDDNDNNNMCNNNHDINAVDVEEPVADVNCDVAEW